jgi:GH25 family lysozyme M1 (1,4-beta-N-acetylmuramidase)
MAEAVQDLRRMEPELAEDFTRIFADSHKPPTQYFAWLAAFPMLLTPHLLYRLWLNFPVDSQGRSLDIPWVAVADLLLSDLVKPVGFETYEMDGTVRDLFIGKLRNQSDPKVFPCFGPACLARLSGFLLEYITPQLKSRNDFTRRRAEVQQLNARAFTEPESAMLNLAEQITDSIQASDFSAQLRLSAIVEMLTSALREHAGFVELQDYTRQRAGLVRGTRPSSDRPASAGLTVSIPGISLPPLDLNLPPPGPAMQAETLMRQASAALENRSFAEAQALLSQARALQPGHPRLVEMENQLKVRWSQALLDQIESDLAEGRYAGLKGLLEQVRSLLPDEPRLAQMESRLSNNLSGQEVQDWYDFNIRFVRSGALFDIYVSSPAGETIVPGVKMPESPNEKEFGAFLERTGPQAPAPDLLRQWGEGLFRTVIWEGCRALYQQSLAIVRFSGGGLRILLDFKNASDLQNLPWEYLYDPEQKQFLIPSNRIMICRYLPGEVIRNETSLTPPTRMSVMISRAVDSPSDIEEAWKTAKTLLAQAALEKRVDLVEILLRDKVSGLSLLRTKLFSDHPKILFIIGDALPDPDGDLDLIKFSKVSGPPKKTSIDLIADSLRSRPPALAVVLVKPANAFYQNSSFERFVKTLLAAKVRAVITTAHAPSTDANRVFLVELCRALLTGSSLDVAFHDACTALANQKYFEWGNYLLFTSERQPQPLFISKSAVKVERQKPEPSPVFKPHPGWTLGVNASERQGDVNWRQIAQDSIGIRFVFLHATTGDDERDKEFDASWEGAHQAGLLCGLYHVFRYSQYPTSQADFFYKVAGYRLKANDLPPVVDIEQTVRVRAQGDPYKKETLWTARQRSSNLHDFLVAVEDQTGLKPILYTSPSIWKEEMGDTDDFTEYPLWVAQYETDEPVVPAKNWDNNGWIFWQFAGSVSRQAEQGSSRFDLNWFKGSLDDLQEWIKKSQGRRTK